ncbi:G-patch domain and KOW motifs-containing protein-like isoform X2 [Bombus bifarius]|uniref:G-patch domain and KOW motifs-containing protein-like isoform X2 n=1 Tax=Bombus bifarius TaxID=103933 RepID=A0A6P8N1U3_9HYME|nr:G-patch domain and KOW motifs-containing protein-like isoform X2 [Bombus bifarius]
MAEEGKKISFGFAKSIRKPVLKNVIPQEEKKVDYIECLDEKGIKVIGEEEKKDEPLIIPLLGSKTWHDRIVNKIDADIFLPKADKEKVEDTSVNESKLSNGKTSPIISIKKEPVEDSENKVVTLEEQAAKEIIEELKSKNEHDTKTNDLTLPLVEDESLRGKEQSTLEDYEKIPIDAFGVAMLRGMGWQPGKGIGRNEKLVAAVIPELRPKGMGLGADKVALQKKNTDSKKEEEELKIEKGTFVKIIAGKQSNNYGQIEGFDDDAGRLIIKLALGGNIISVNEFMVQPVTKSEYSKNSKVLNTKKYEEYKDKESKGLKQKTDRKRSMSPELEDSEDGDKSSNKRKKIKSTMHNKDKYDKMGDKKSERRKRRSESNDDGDSDSEKKRRRERSNSNSSDSYKSKRLKKSKKHKKHNCSSERSSKKHKKKDKEREKVRDKKSRDYADRKKHKRRERSRSRSFSRQ